MTEQRMLIMNFIQERLVLNQKVKRVILPAYIHVYV